MIMPFKTNSIKSKVIKVGGLLSDIKNKIKNPYFKNIDNKKNLKFVLDISKKLKLNSKKVLQSINSFKGLKFRQQVIYKNKRLLIINNSKSTNFSSSINLLKSYKNIYWLVGGKFKRGDRFQLNSKFHKNIHAYIVGKYAKFFVQEMRNKVKYNIFKNTKKALEKIVHDTKKNNLYPANIIFSPAAASFDQFNNFEERGKNFNYLVGKLKIINKINAR